jgi:hypothetical protein
MEKTGITKKLGIAATVISITAGSLALWDKVKPGEEVPDLTGKWRIALTPETSQPTKWIGHTWVFDVHVTPHGDGFKGTGEQVLYDDEPPTGFNKFALDPFQFRNDKVIVGFTANISRETTGMLRLKYDPENPKMMTGTFTWDAANKEGTATVEVSGE